MLVPKDRFCGDMFNLSSRGYGHALASWSRAVKERDSLTCGICSIDDINSKMRSHHLLYKNTHPLLSLNVNNGITLCIPCHNELHYGKSGGDV